MFDCPQNLREEEMFEVPDWAANKVVYQIFPARFAASQQVDKEQWYKAPISSMDDLHGDLRGIIEHLDHVQNLGIDVLYMTPIFKSYSSHKYDIIDYYQIDPSFGTTEDLRELVQEAHKRGMKSSWMQCSTIQEENFLHLRISWKREKNQNIWIGIILRNFHLKMKEKRFQLQMFWLLWGNA